MVIGPAGWMRSSATPLPVVPIVSDRKVLAENGPVTVSPFSGVMSVGTLSSGRAR